MPYEKNVEETKLRFRTRKGNFVLISAADTPLSDHIWSEFDRVKRHSVSTRIERSFRRDGKLCRVLLHREVAKRMLGRSLGSEDYVIHINKDYYDCRRENLAVLTKSQLTARHPKRLKGTEKRILKGETCYLACVYEAGGIYKIGPFESRLLAGLAYDLTVQRVRSKIYSYLNFPQPLSVFSQDEIDMVADRVSEALNKNHPTLWHAVEGG